MTDASADLDGMPSVIAFLATGAGSGKTTSTIGLGRHLSNLGVDVTPLKAVSVVYEGDDAAYASAEPMAWGTMHNAAAARVAFQPWHNPVTVLLDEKGGSAGELFVLGRSFGRAELIAADCLDIGRLTPRQRAACRDAVQRSIETARAAGSDVLLVEGAGGVCALAPELDLSNVVLPRSLGAHVVFVYNVRIKEGLEVLTSASHRCRSWGLNVRGFVLNQVPDDFAWTGDGEAALGRIAETPDLDDYDASPAQLEFLYERSAAAVQGSGLIQALKGAQ